MLSPKQTMAGRVSAAAAGGAGTAAGGAGCDSAFGAGASRLPQPHNSATVAIKQNLSI
jgi:hypothetical protein